MKREHGISILGYGFVGSACGFLCEKNGIDYNVYDVQNKDGDFNFFDNVSELVSHSEKSFDINSYIICVPTPSDSQGNCDVSIVHKVLTQLDAAISKESYIFIKSTLKPGTCNKFHQEFPRLNIVFFPEFLKEATHKDDIYNAEFALVGISKDFDMGKYKKVLKIIRLLYKHNSQIEILMKSFEECEIFKYTLNTFFATKITFFNEIYELCESMNVDYQKLKEMFPLDARIGNYGIHVPGYDRKYGYGGHCLPKEMLGMIKLQKELGLSSEFMRCVDERNKYFKSKGD